MQSSHGCFTEKFYVNFSGFWRWLDVNNFAENRVLLLKSHIFLKCYLHHYAMMKSLIYRKVKLILCHLNRLLFCGFMRFFTNIFEPQQ